MTYFINANMHPETS